ncbi:GNAT family N-acetyltransferase [Roseobacter weihaiensis]|uniref:GNAT family N-acetyltransferase n=1 Tax=Roseobacter weihaiensis TaxID=2763262 RepID=UPI001D0ABE44|nr:GNAT family N-acetyltransferase [Roseobacter sp. H9]
MSMQQKITPTVRAATAQDIPFLAKMDVEASKPPFGTSFWDELLEGTGTDTLTFLEAMFREAASNWGDVSDFIILESDGVPVATCAVFKPEPTPASEGPLNLGKLDQIAWALSWSDDTKNTFRAAYEKVWSGDTGFLKPQADLIIETVAVAPDHRGKGFGTALMQAAFTRGRDLGANSIGIMVIHGNDGAQALYEKHFEPFATFHGAYFDHEFPGLTKYRASLTQEKE